MKSYWLTGFTNAQGFLTAVRQEVTRQHKAKDAWALDDVGNHTEILQQEVDKLKDVPEEGQNIHGLFMEGARWNKPEARIDESEPKKLFVPMAVIYLTAGTTSGGKKGKSEWGPFAPFDCPVYKYPRRNDKYLIFRILLKTNVHNSHWRLRGCCLLAQVE